MKKVTHDMLTDFSQVVQSFYQMLYPMGLTMEELEKKAQERTWIRMIYDRFKEDVQ